MKGCLIKHLQMRGGERWPGNDVALEMRRNGPAVQAASCPGAPTARHWAGDDGNGEWSRSAGADLGLTAVDRRPANPRGEARLPETVSPPGALRSRPQTSRAGRRGTGGLAALQGLDKPRCREASRPVGLSIFVCAFCVNLNAPGPEASRAPFSFLGGRLNRNTAYPAPIKEHGR